MNPDEIREQDRDVVVSLGDDPGLLLQLFRDRGGQHVQQEALVLLIEMVERQVGRARARSSCALKGFDT